MSDDVNKLKQQFALWARNKGIRKPDTVDGMKALFGQFLQELHARQQAIATWNEVNDDEPILVTDGSTVDIADPLKPEDDDDFHELVSEREQTLHEMGGDDLARDVHLQDKARAQLGQVAPFTRIQPPSVLNGVLGGQVTAASAIAKGGVMPKGMPVQVANWQGTDDSETTPVTVTFIPVQQLGTSAGANVAPRPVGLVTFGTKGFASTLEVDIGTGCQFTVSGSSVTLSVFMDGFGVNGSGNPVADGSQVSMILAGMLSFHSVFRTTPIKRTVYFDLLAGIGDNIVAVPAFASRVWFVRNNTATVSANLFFKDAAGEIKYDFTLATGTQMNDPIALAGDITAIDVVKTAGASTFASLIFELEL